MKQFIKRIPVIGTLATSAKKLLFPQSIFTTSEEYWIQRYKSGGNSGAGSYNNLAAFKGEVINEFVSKNKIETVIEFGCGDGNQLEYFKFPSYIGFDISPFIVSKCRERFKQDEHKQFLLFSEISNQGADLLLSLDVIYHLIEDEVYHSYMNELFDRAISYVIIYSFDEDSDDFAPHIRTRKFTKWIEENKADFELIKHIPNKYPSERDKEETTSFCDFYFYRRIR